MNRDVPGVDWDPLWFRFTYRLVFEVTLISSVFRIPALALRWATSLVHDEFMSFFHACPDVRAARPAVNHRVEHDVGGQKRHVQDADHVAVHVFGLSFVVLGCS